MVVRQVDGPPAGECSKSTVLTWPASRNSNSVTSLQAGPCNVSIVSDPLPAI
jgi:hypothetical protein